MSKSMYAIAIAAAAFIAASAAADEKGPGTSGSDTAVYTRAVVRSLSAEANGKLYIRLKLLPRSKFHSRHRPSWLQTDVSLPVLRRGRR